MIPQTPAAPGSARKGPPAQQRVNGRNSPWNVTSVLRGGFYGRNMIRSTLALCLSAAPLLAQSFPDGAEGRSASMPTELGIRPAGAVQASRPLPDGPASQTDILRAELRPGWREPDGRHIAALHLELAPHWKTYWRAPGDSGIPPEFDWSGSRNLRALRVHWPSPEVFDFQGMQSIGYRHEVVLPVEIIPEDPSIPVELNAAVALGLCNEVCMPAALTLDLPLPPQGAPDPVISAALAAQPVPAAQAGLTALHCTVDRIEDGLRVTARMDMPRLAAVETVVMEPDAPIWVSDATVTRDGGLLVAVADFVPPPGAPVFLDMQALRLTVLGSGDAPGRAVEVTGCPPP